MSKQKRPNNQVLGKVFDLHRTTVGGYKLGYYYQGKPAKKIECPAKKKLYKAMVEYCQNHPEELEGLNEKD